jgi:hypothetical protein
VKQFPGAKLPAALLLALGAAVASGLLYPGDNGYSLTQNYLSDLGMTVTRDGEENPAGALLFLGSCGAFGYSVRRFARLLGSARGGGIGRRGLSAGGALPGGREIGPVESPDTTGRERNQGAGRQVSVADTRSGGERLPADGALPGGAPAGLLYRLGRVGVLLGGFLTAVFFLLTGLTPKNQLFHLHNWVSYSAFLALLLLWVSAALIGPPGWPRGVHVSMVLLSAGYLAVLFSRPSWEMPEGWALQVVAQKAVVIGNWLGLFLGGILLRSAIVSRET